MKLFYLFDLFRTEEFSRPQILARPVGHLCLSSHSPSKKEIFIILLSTSMASSKNIQASTIATSTKLGTATTNNYIGANNRSQPKAHNQLQAQSTKEAKVQTIINTNSYLWNYFTCLTYFEPRNLVVHKFWHARWDISTFHLFSFKEGNLHHLATNFNGL